jgi:Coenzyme PQQ synthesis protein D (PqqD).
MKSEMILNIFDVVSRKKGIDDTNIDDEKVMMDMDKGEYYVLNEVASKIWDMIDKPLCIKDIVDVLLEEYDVDCKVCNESVIQFLVRLNNVGLINLN